MICGALLLGSLVPGRAATTVKPVTYQGWSNAVEIANGEVRLVVVAEVGRIVHYGFADGPNLLWLNPDLHGQPGITPPAPAAGAELPDWRNIGGDKVWPMPQSAWPEAHGTTWPPDPFIDGAPHILATQPDGVVLVSPESPYCRARIEREIRLAPQGTRVTIRQTLIKTRPPDAVAAPALPHTLWNVTQVRPAEQLLFPFRTMVRAMMNPEAAVDHLVLRDGVGIVTPADGFKIGADAAPWVAALVDNTVMAAIFEPEHEAAYPDQGARVEIYTAADYAELEVLSPLARLKPEARLNFTLAWELWRLPDDAASPAARRDAALAWLRTLSL